MSPSVRGLLVAISALLVLSAAGPAAPALASPPARAQALPGGVLDGFGIGRLPPGTGGLVTDFAFEWGGTRFASRVWESGPGPSGGYRVDVNIKVLRSPGLDSPQALRDFLLGYYDVHLSVAEWGLHPFGADGYTAEGEVFWLAAPGVGVSVRTDPRRFDRADLLATACGVRPWPAAAPAPGGCAGHP
ncbi:hypothetical protein [Allonocardiopsis opalescens]|uniref:Secreted protein n=1 Tax=Allonocardiopsis opalescens TaxID=1144618 RepID=A0A2T0PVK6_9ACTN|nr:hypothetical protein [Allonocardiopsis opalescens]PRX95470.1 hypothetical protein CLV72_10978 [Allonocardiopsis opalescens]